MANDPDKPHLRIEQFRLTADQLAAEKVKAEKEKAAREKRERELQALIQKAVEAWNTRIGRAFAEAIHLANRILKGDQIQLARHEFQGPGPQNIKALSGLVLPGVDVIQVKPGVAAVAGPARTRGETAAQKRARIEAFNTGPRLHVAVDTAGSVTATTHNYKHQLKEDKISRPASEFNDELIQRLVTEFVNHGIVGHLPEGERPPDQAAPNETPATPDQTQQAFDKARTDSQSRARIITAVRQNQASLDLTATAVLTLLNEKIDALSKPNSEEGIAQLNSYLELKAKIEEFIDAIGKFSAGAADENSAVEATISLETGVVRFWNKDHVEICRTVFNGAIFTLLFGLCMQAGAGGVLATVVPGVLVGGKLVVDAIKAVLGKA